jgi:HSP20 family protein
MLTDLVRWDPFRELVAMRAQMDRLVGQVATEEGARLPRRWSPATDVIERDDEILITAELPGVKDEDVEISVRDGVLRIAGERRLEDEVKEDRYYRLERSYGGFERSFPLPRGVEEKDITAGIAYGVLRVRIPKPKASEPTRIPINPEG